MARPKSEDKRNAILSAAVRLFAERGLAATPTSAISKEAGVAEGSLFTYFATKDDLVNALYCEIKLELADALMSGFPRKKSVRAKMQHIWDCFVNWGVSNPKEHEVLAQLEVSGKLTHESKEAGYAPFAEIQEMAQEAIAQRILQDIPQEFVSATLRALAETTMEFMIANPATADAYRKSGFEMFWAGIARRK